MMHLQVTHHALRKEKHKVCTAHPLNLHKSALDKNRVTIQMRSLPGIVLKLTVAYFNACKYFPITTADSLVSLDRASCKAGSFSSNSIILSLPTKVDFPFSGFSS